MLRAFTLAPMCPSGPTVRLPPSNSTLPSNSPSRRTSPLPETSPLITIDFPICVISERKLSTDCPRTACTDSAGGILRTGGTSLGIGAGLLSSLPFHFHIAPFCLSESHSSDVHFSSFPRHYQRPPL